MIKKKILLLGLDGVSWSIIDKMINKGIMPNMKKLKEKGAFAPMKSSYPPLTPSCWPTIYTGKSVPNHGIFGWNKYHNGGRNFVTSSNMDSITFAEILEQNGYNITSINLPLSKPLRLSKSKVVDHFTDKDPEIVYPQELKNEIDFSNYKKAFNEPTWYQKRFTDWKIIILKKILNNLENNISVIKQLAAKEWDVFMFLFSHTDWVLHAACYEILHNKRGKRLKLAQKIYEKIDYYIGELIALKKHDYLMIISDHGFTYFDQLFHVNTFLQQNDFLKYKIKLKKNFPMNSVKYYVYQLSKKNNLVDNVFRKIFPYKNLWFLEIDQSNSDAFLQSKHDRGIFINDAKFTGRIKEEQKEKVINAVLYKFKEYIKAHNLPIEMVKTRDVFEGKNLEDLPDIYFFSKTIFPNIKPSNSIISKTILNEHNQDAIFYLKGHGVNVKEHNQIDMMDVAPTILHLLECPVPDDIDGSVLHSLFKEDADFNKQAPEYQHIEYIPPTEKENQDEEILKNQLRALGYLD